MNVLPDCKIGHGHKLGDLTLIVILHTIEQKLLFLMSFGYLVQGTFNAGIKFNKTVRKIKFLLILYCKMSRNDHILAALLCFYLPIST